MSNRFNWYCHELAAAQPQLVFLCTGIKYSLFRLQVVSLCKTIRLNFTCLLCFQSYRTCFQRQIKKVNWMQLNTCFFHEEFLYKIQDASKELWSLNFVPLNYESTSMNSFRLGHSLSFLGFSQIMVKSRSLHKNKVLKTDLFHMHFNLWKDPHQWNNNYQLHVSPSVKVYLCLLWTSWAWVETEFDYHCLCCSPPPGLPNFLPSPPKPLVFQPQIHLV